MTARPAPRLSITWTAAARQELALIFDLEAAPTAEQHAGLERAVASFISLGAHGGFCRESAAPSESSLRLLQTNLTVPTRPAFLLDAAHLDVRAFQLIRQSAWRWSAEAAPVRSVTVIDRTAGQQARPVQLPEATWSTEADAYPPQSRQVSLRLEREDPADYQKLRRCVIEFGRKVPNDVFVSAADPISAWVAVAGAGAYGPPVKPSFEAEVWQENLGPYDEYSMELALQLFEASEAAWYTLVNCLDRYSTTTERIALVTIE